MLMLLESMGKCSSMPGNVLAYHRYTEIENKTKTKDKEIVGNQEAIE